MNPHKGDVALRVGEEDYTLRYSHSALVALERALDKGLLEIMEQIASARDMRLGTVVALLWAGLQKHHPGMSEGDACDLLDDIEGGAAGAVAVIDEAFRRAFNAPGTKGTNPPTSAGNGIGTLSSSSTPALDTTPTRSGT